MLYEVTYKTQRVDERGAQKHVKETLLVEAATFGHAETCVYEEFRDYDSSIDVIAVKRSAVGGVLRGEVDDEEAYFIARGAFIALDEQRGTERRMRETILVQASDLDRAHRVLSRVCGGPRSYEIESVKKSAIIGLLHVSFDEV